MNWNDLKYFLAIVDDGSLTRASNALGVNHSTVFRRLEALELELDQVLFDRSSKKYQLTLDGERLLKVAREAQSALEKVDTQILGKPLVPSGSVRVSLPRAISIDVAALVVERVNKEYPEITVEFQTSSSVSRLKNGKADIVCIATTGPSAEFTAAYLTSHGWGLYGSSHIADTFKQDPANTPLISIPLVRDEDEAITEAHTWAERQYPNVVTRCDDPSLTIELAFSDVGLVVLPDNLQYEDLIQLRKISSAYQQLWLLTYPKTHSQPSMRIVWDILVDEIKEAFA